MASNEGKTLDAVVRLIEQRDGQNRADVRRPEQDHSDPRTVDLCLRLGSLEYAFEHTRIEPFTGQISQDRKFAKLIELLEDALWPEHCRERQLTESFFRLIQISRSIKRSCLRCNGT